MIGVSFLFFPDFFDPRFRIGNCYCTKFIVQPYDCQYACETEDQNEDVHYLLKMILRMSKANPTVEDNQK